MAGKGGGNDVLLVFGVQEGQSRLNIKNGLESIINGLEPFKIKVQLDESSKKSIKSALMCLARKRKGFWPKRLMFFHLLPIHSAC